MISGGKKDEEAMNNEDNDEEVEDEEEEEEEGDNEEEGKEVDKEGEEETGDNEGGEADRDEDEGDEEEEESVRGGLVNRWGAGSLGEEENQLLLSLEFFSRAAAIVPTFPIIISLITFNLTASCPVVVGKQDKVNSPFSSDLSVLA
jgi:hypothetical protein